MTRKETTIRSIGCEYEDVFLERLTQDDCSEHQIGFLDAGELRGKCFCVDQFLEQPRLWDMNWRAAVYDLVFFRKIVHVTSDDGLAVDWKVFKARLHVSCHDFAVWFFLFVEYTKNSIGDGLALRCPIIQGIVSFNWFAGGFDGCGVVVVAIY